MALTGEMIDAREALACGLVARVVPDGDLQGAARAVAEKIAANPPHAVRMTKRLLREGQTSSLESVLRNVSCNAGSGPRNRGPRWAVQAFLDRRDPTFKLKFLPASRDKFHV